MQNVFGDLSQNPVCGTVSRIRLAVSVVSTLAMMGSLIPNVVAQQANPGKQVAGAAISENEAQDFARGLEEAVTTGDFNRANQLMSWGALIDLSTEIPKLPELKPTREAFKKGAMGALRGKGLFVVINAEIEKGGSYHFLRASVQEKEPYVQFRLKLPNGGLNYHRFYLVRQPDRKIIATDIYILVSAERMSQTLHRSWLPLATQAIREQGKKKNDAAADTFNAEIQATLKIITLNQEGKFPEVLAEYEKSMESVRREKNILLIRLLAAQNVSDEEYMKSIDDFRKYYPQDPALDFILIDQLILRKDYDKALGCVDRTMESLGKDSALLTTRANILLLQEKVPEALEEIKKAMAAEPDLVDPYSAALDISIAARDNDETASLLTVLETKFGYEWKDLKEVPVFEDFVKSPQFEKWVKTQKKGK